MLHRKTKSKRLLKNLIFYDILISAVRNLIGLDGKRKRRFVRAAVILLVIIAAGIRICSKLYGPEILPLNLTRSAIYIGLIVAWGISVQKRIIMVQARYCLMAISFLMTFWLIVRTVKYYFVQSGFLSRQLWYWYYLALLFIPLMALFVSFSLGKPDNYRLPKKYMLLCIPAALILLMILTNDLHHFVFVFPEGKIPGDSDYSYAFGMYIAVAWQIICGTIAVANIIIKCRIFMSKYRLWMPMIPLGAAMLYTLLYALDLKLIKLFVGDMTVTLCLLITAIFEYCIQCGLIQSNIGYDSLYEATTIPSLITDGDFNVINASSTAVKLKTDDMKSAVSDAVLLDENTVLKGQEIRAGYVFWQEDITELAEVSRELELIQEELLDTGDVIKAESEQKEYWLRIVEENRLYDLIEAETASQIEKLKQLTQSLKETDDLDDARRLLREIVVIGTYIKRKSNIILICGQNDKVDSYELKLCVDETIRSLQLYGAACSVVFDINGYLVPEVINGIYDFLEEVIECSLNSLKGILIYIGCENNNYRVNISVSCDEELSALNEKIPMLVSELDDDGAWCLSLEFDKVGDSL